MPRPPDLAKRRDLAHRAVLALEKEGLTISAEQLARAVGVNRTTLLYHFPTHHDVVRTVLGELLVEQALFVNAHVDEHDHPIERLYARMCAVLEFHAGKERRLLFLSQAMAVTSAGDVGAVVKSASDLFEADRRALVEGIERGVREGVVAPCDARALVALTRAVIDGLTIQRVAEGASIDAAREHFYAAVLAPLVRRPPAGTRRKKRA